MAHVPRVPEEERALFRLLALLCGRDERIGHASDAVLLEGFLSGEMEGGGELRDDVLQDLLLQDGEGITLRCAKRNEDMYSDAPSSPRGVDV